jgi:hypothetical protein
VWSLPTGGIRFEENAPHPGAFLREPGGGSPQGPPSEVSELTSWSFLSGRFLPGVFRFLHRGAALRVASNEDSLGSPQGLFRETIWRYAAVVFSFGRPPQRHPAGDLDSVAFDGLRTRFECSIAAWWQHQETNHDRLLRRLRFCGSVEMKGAGRVSADARRATSAARSRSSDPQQAACRFGNPQVLDVRSLTRPNMPRASVACEGAARESADHPPRRRQRRQSNPEIRGRSRLRTCGNGHFSHVVSVRESKGMGGRRR